MVKKYCSFLLLLLHFCYTNAQVNLSTFSEISIITTGSGEQIYEAFGHSAIRVKDPVLQLDLIYNYGVFDFNQPNFELNFAKGNMIYSLARYEFKYFLRSYKKDKRWVKQQVLNLTQKERQAFFSFLENNALQKNRAYLYDPYFNNCATKPRDIIKHILKNNVSFKDNYLQKNLTFRDLTNKEIHWNTWGSFGLNLIAGTKLDQIAQPEEYQFLPDYSFKAFKHATKLTNNQLENLVIEERLLLSFKEKKVKTSSFNPFLIFLLVSILGIYITYKDIKHQKRSRICDFLLFFFSGIIGLILILLWLFSTHSTAPNNFNILWLFPLNLLVSFLLLKKNFQYKWIKHYIQFLLLLLLCIPILWYFKVQVFHLAIIPILLLLVVRYSFLSKNLLPSKV